MSPILKVNDSGPFRSLLLPGTFDHDHELTASPHFVLTTAFSLSADRGSHSGSCTHERAFGKGVCNFIGRIQQRTFEEDPWTSYGQNVPDLCARCSQWFGTG